MIDKATLIGTVGHFTWSFGREFHIETPVGNFVWSDPDYNGDNTIKPCGTYSEWCYQTGLEYGRCKGDHYIGDYCGVDFTLVE